MSVSDGKAARNQKEVVKDDNQGRLKLNKEEGKVKKKTPTKSRGKKDG